MIRKVQGGYKLISKKTGKQLSKKPKSFTQVRKQEAAIEIAKHARRRARTASRGLTAAECERRNGNGSGRIQKG